MKDFAIAPAYLTYITVYPTLVMSYCIGVMINYIDPPGPIGGLTFRSWVRPSRNKTTLQIQGPGLAGHLISSTCNYS